MDQLCFYSPGKLLLTGEYLVLDGVKSLAVPSKMGQSMKVKTGKPGYIVWKSYDFDQSLWMDETLLIQDIVQGHIEQGGSGFYKVLMDVLIQAHTLNPNLLNPTVGFQVDCYLSFPRLWGLGTSSTWINNLAQWFEINPYELLNNSFKGSGYDIACANSTTPIWYTKSGNTPLVSPVTLDCKLTDKLYFVYLNKKQDSKQGIANYRANKVEDPVVFTQICQEIETISQNFSKAEDLQEINSLLSHHEQIICKLTKQPTVKQQLFADFQGAVKSLGAWGGDFIMVGSDQDPSPYFISKGYPTILAYKDMVL